jgi:hypothetical protein
VHFQTSVVNFSDADMSLAGSTVGGTLSAHITAGSGSDFTVTVTGMTGRGTLVLSIPAGTVMDINGVLNSVSTSIDDTVIFDAVTPTPHFSQSASNYAPSNAMSVAAGDFNEDGLPDVVASSSGGVSTYINDGGGGLYDEVDMGLGVGAPRTVRVADIDGDGHLDLLACNDSSAALAILRGNGDGSFRAPIVVLLGSATPQGFTITDFNGDGKLDVAVSMGDRIAVLLNNGGSNILGAPSFFAVGTLQLAIGIDSADFNGDGKADLAVAQHDGDAVTVYRGNGNGTFGAGTSYSTGTASAPSGLIARDANGILLDFNKDGKPDLAIGYSGNGFVGRSPSRAVIREQGGLRPRTLTGMAMWISWVRATTMPAPSRSCSETARGDLHSPFRSAIAVIPMSPLLTSMATVLRISRGAGISVPGSSPLRSTCRPP